MRGASIRLRGSRESRQRGWGPVVDLVKIRKKAKEQKEREAAAATQPSRPAGETVGTDVPPGPSAAERLERFKASLSVTASGSAGHEESEESEGSAGEELEVLTFTIGPEEYAIPIDSVVEIVTPGEITRVPNTPRNISGIISLRGTIVAILDVRGKLGHEPVAPDLDTRIVVVRDSGASAGFIVDKVLRVVKVGAGELEIEPVASPAARNDKIKGVFRREDSLSILLDIDRLLGDDASDDPDV